MARGDAVQAAVRAQRAQPETGARTVHQAQQAPLRAQHAAARRQGAAAGAAAVRRDMRDQRRRRRDVRGAIRCGPRAPRARPPPRRRAEARPPRADVRRSGGRDWRSRLAAAGSPSSGRHPMRCVGRHVETAVSIPAPSGNLGGPFTDASHRPAVRDDAGRAAARARHRDARHDGRARARRRAGPGAPARAGAGRAARPRDRAAAARARAAGRGRARLRATLDRLAVGVGPGHVHRACGSASRPPARSRRRTSCRSSASPRCASLAGRRRARPDRAALAVLDARRGEAFAAAGPPTPACGPTRPAALAPAALSPQALADAAAALPAAAGSRRRRGTSSGTACKQPVRWSRRTAPPLHRVDAAVHCAARGGGGADRARRGPPGLPARSRTPSWRSADGAPRTVTARRPTLEIRRLTYADLPQVIAIERRAFPTPWSLAMFVLELSKPSGVCLAARARRRRLVGYLICSRYDAVWHLMNIAVDPDRAPAGHRDGAAERAARADRRRQRQRAAHARGPPVQPRARSRCTSASASARPGMRPPLLPGQRRGRADHVAHARRRSRAGSTTCRTWRAAPA